MTRYVVAFSSVLVVCLGAGMTAIAQDPALDAEFRSRLESLAPDDVGAHVELLTWCEENKLEELSEVVSKRILDLDPENRQARLALKHRRVPPGRWLTLDEYHDYRGDVLVDGEWRTIQEWRRLVTEGRRKISPWSEVQGGQRVDTQHFVISTDGNERFTNDISHLAELSFMVFCELMDCREVVLPPEVAKVGPEVDLSRARFANLAEDGGASFVLPNSLQLTCWTSGAMLLHFPSGKEVMRGIGGAMIMKGLDGQDRLIRPFMTADDRIILEVLRSKTQWTDLRLQGDSTDVGTSAAMARVPGDRVILWRAISPRHEPVDIRELTDQAYYYLAHHFVRLFAPDSPLWFQHAVGEYFERGAGYRGQINLKKYDKVALRSAYQRLSGAARLSASFNNTAIVNARGYSRMVDKKQVRFPILYAFVCYAAQRDAPTTGLAGSAGSVLQAVYREIALGKDPQAAIEKAADQNIESFQNDMLKWLDRYSDAGRRSF